MTYEEQYEQLIAAARADVANRSKGNYEFDNHHIFARCQSKALGLEPDDSTENLVLLNRHEHLEAHRLLTKIHPSHSGLASAYVFMRNLNKEYPADADYYAAMELHRAAAAARWKGDSNPARKPENRDNLSKRRLAEVEAGSHTFQAAEYRAALSKRMTELAATEDHPAQTQAFRDAQSERWLELYANGLHPAQKQEFREASAARGKEAWAGNKNPSKSQRHQERMRGNGNPMHKPENQAKAAATQRVEHTCPYCSKIGKGNGFKYWHFDNCLEHPDYKGLTRKQIKETKGNVADWQCKHCNRSTLQQAVCVIIAIQSNNCSTTNPEVTAMLDEDDIEALAKGVTVIDSVAYEAQVTDSGNVEIYDLSEDANQNHT